MKQKKKWLNIFLFGVLFGVLFSSLSSGAIVISEPNPIYNLGDELDIRIDGIIGATSGNMNVNLNCKNNTINLVRLPGTSFDLVEETSFEFSKILTRSDLEIINLTSVIGNCQISTSLGSEYVATGSFFVSQDVDVVATLNQTTFDPKDPITVSIQATKANGDNLEGFIEGSGASFFSKEVSNGNLVETFYMPETIEAGPYDLEIFAYELIDNEIMNTGSSTVSFVINQIPSAILVSLSDSVAIPGEEFTIGTEITDQSGKLIEGLVTVTLTSPADEEIILNIPANSFESIDFFENATAGAWLLVAKFHEIEEVREFEVAPNMKAEYAFEDSVLLIKNVGNVVFNKTISVTIGEDVLDLELQLDLGEERKFGLKAGATGEYEVVVSDGDSETAKRIPLTGNAVGISDLEEVGFFANYSIIWVFLIVVLGAIVIVLFIRSKKTKKLGSKKGLMKDIGGKPDSVAAASSKKIAKTAVKAKEGVTSRLSSGIKSGIDNSLNFTKKSPEVAGLDGGKNVEDKTLVDLTAKKAGVAESSLVLKGEKHVSSVISLSIKNYSALGKHAQEGVQNIVHSLESSKGLVDWRGEFVFIVYSPIITRTYKNEILAAKSAMDLLSKLQDYNKKFKDKIEFNIGVHTGELIASKVNNKLKYTSVGNTISFAKRISDSARDKVLVSEEIRKKLLRDITVGNGGSIGEKQTYEILKIKDRGADQEKLKELLKRM